MLTTFLAFLSKLILFQTFTDNTKEATEQQPPPKILVPDSPFKVKVALTQAERAAIDATMVPDSSDEGEEPKVCRPKEQKENHTQTDTTTNVSHTTFTTRLFHDQMYNDQDNANDKETNTILTGKMIILGFY